MDRRLRDEVRRRAQNRCEYCQFPEQYAELRFQIDHIVPEQHGGPTASDNLALSCLRCNKQKGPNLSGLDPANGEIVRLFHPRRDAWQEHFAWDGPSLTGITAIGRATVQLLQMNRLDAKLVRQALMEEGVW